MNHIFCENQEQANDRLKKIYKAYNDNPENILRFLDNILNNCSNCLKTYLSCNPEEWFEKQRICINFSPEKVYDWNLLFDENIFAEYKACVNYPSAYDGFKAIFFLIKEKIRNYGIWKKIRLNTVKIGEKEIKALVSGKIGTGISLFRAISLLLPLISSKYLILIQDLIFKTYLENKEVESTITELRIELLDCLLRLNTIQRVKSEYLKIIFTDLLENKKENIIIKNYDLFKDYCDNINRIINNLQMFDVSIFNFIVFHINDIEINFLIVNELLEFLSKHKNIKIEPDAIKLSILFYKITLWVIKNLECKENRILDKLVLADYFQFQDSACWLLYINLFFDISIQKIVHSNKKSLLISHLASKRNEAKKFLDSTVIEFIDEINEFKPFVNQFKRIEILISIKIVFNFTTAKHFVETFGVSENILRNIISDFSFNENDIEEFLTILNDSEPDLIELLYKEAVIKNQSTKLINIFKKYYRKIHNIEVSDVESPNIKFDQARNFNSNSFSNNNNLNNNNISNNLNNNNNISNNNLGANDKKVPKVLIKKRTVNPLNEDQNVLPTNYVEFKRKLNNNLPETTKDFDTLKRKAAEIIQNNAEKEAIILNTPVKKQAILENNESNINLSLSSSVPTNSINSSSVGSSIASRIAQRTNNAFLAQNQVLQKSVVIDTQENFFHYALYPFDIAMDLEMSKNPINFNSYNEYQSFFRPLQINELIANIKTSIITKSQYFEGIIHSFDNTLKIKTTASTLEVYDLLYLSTTKVYFNQSSSSQSFEKANINGIVGIITNINTGTVIDDHHNKDIIEIKISTKNFDKLKKISFSRTKIFYKYCGNIISNLREYTALSTIKGFKSLKYVLRPSFLSDFKQSLIYWDDKNLSFTSNQAKLSYISSTILNKNQPILENMLIKTHNLNRSQAEAISKSFYSREKFFLIQGPPGTGKSTTILSIISTFLFVPQDLHSLDEDQCNFTPLPLKILVCAPSNTAIDVIVLRLSTGLRTLTGEINTSIKFLRLGASTNQSVSKYTLEYLINNPSVQFKSRQSLISEASVICTTLNSSVSDSMNNFKFDLIIIDEACQATELSSIIPLKYNPDKIIMVGDPNQLPPTVISDQPLLQFSLFERMLSYHKPVMLNMQYRMHPEICKLSSQFFYDGLIETSEEISKLRGKSKLGFSYDFNPLNFVDILNGDDRLDEQKSYYNFKEIGICSKIIDILVNKYGKDVKIVVLTPYKGQAKMFRAIKDFDSVEINTIDGFQGKECDIVILSTVRSSGLGFTCDFRRINVAMTRSKECLIILGNRKCLSESNIWKNIIDYVISKTKYYSSGKIDTFLSTL